MRSFLQFSSTQRVETRNDATVTSLYSDSSSSQDSDTTKEHQPACIIFTLEREIGDKPSAFVFLTSKDTVKMSALHDCQTW